MLWVNSFCFIWTYQLWGEQELPINVIENCWQHIILPATNWKYLNNTINIYNINICERSLISIKSTYLKKSISRRTNSNYDYEKDVKAFTGKAFLNIQHFFSLLLYLEQKIVSWEEFM